MRTVFVPSGALVSWCPMNGYMKKKSRYNIAIMGATGAVGQEMVRILEERKFPVESIVFLASERSAGKPVAFNGKTYDVQVLNERSFDNVDIVLASAGGSVSRKYAPIAVAKVIR